MGVNVLLFLVFQIGVEPWRRKRLVKGFEEKVMEALEREGPTKGSTLAEAAVASRAAESLPSSSTASVGSVDAEVPSTPIPEPTAPTVIEETPIAEFPEGRVEDGVAEGGVEHGIALVQKPPVPLSKLDSVRETFQDMFSERQITVRRVDLTTRALEGFGAGFVMVGLVVVLFRPR